MTSAPAEATLEEKEDFAREKPKRTSSLDGSLHVPSSHRRGGKRPNSLDVSQSQRGDPSSALAEEDQREGMTPQPIESHSATDLTDDVDFPILHTEDDDGDDDEEEDDDDDDGDSFCDADDTSRPDLKNLRRAMSVTPDDLEDFIVEYGEEIAEAANAYYDDEDGDRIAVPRAHAVPADEGRRGKQEDDDEGKGEQVKKGDAEQTANAEEADVKMEGEEGEQVKEEGKDT